MSPGFRDLPLLGVETPFPGTFLLSGSGFYPTVPSLALHDAQRGLGLRFRAKLFLLISGRISDRFSTPTACAVPTISLLML